MSKIDNGGPAFPHTEAGVPPEPGMSLRDWLAGMALQAIVASLKERDFDTTKIYVKEGEREPSLSQWDSTRAWVPRTAFVFADAMIAEKRRRKEVPDARRRPRIRP